MKRSTFLTLASFIALAVGALALVAPAVLLGEVKHAQVTDSALVMARTTGVLLLVVGVLALLVRNHPDSPTMRAILLANLLLQLSILPIDPVAYFTGAFHTLGSFLPNTIIHVLLASGFAYFYRTKRTA